jgi:pimeloyl-ACP methyl ester carboxylesterase
VAVVVLAAVLACGCGLRTLKRNIQQAGQQAVIEGRAGIRGEGHAPIIVVVHTVPAGEVVDYFLLARPGPFLFVLPAGTYKLAAFEDRNRDLTYEPDTESAVVFADDLALQPGERRSDLDLSIDPNRGMRLPFPVNAASPQERQLHQLPAPQLGTIAELDDPRFSQEYRDLGLWDPLAFLFTAGAGVYFLAEYDAGKIPILFVHGAVGSPADWKYIVEELDRSRFQPWFFYYPSAPRLERVAQMLVRALSALQVKHDFNELILVAHSMGGLVTRAALNYVMQNPATRRVVQVPVFISISSPWNGHTAAADGVEYSPVVAPMWEDMAPGSAFLKALPETPLPPECGHFLLFGYRGRGGEANDGTVTVESELSMPIQREATRVMGFNETHIGILRSDEVAAKVNAILTGAVR